VKKFNYQNPIDEKNVKAIRDSQIIEVEGIYYLTGTSPEFFKGDNPGIGVYSSIDLVNWKFEKYIIESVNLADDAWYRHRFWAPEIHNINNKFYCSFTCCNEITNYPYSVGIAVSDNILGPYKVITEENALTEGIDLNLFQDDDGKSYAYWSFDNGLIGQEINLKTCELIGDKVMCIKKGVDKEWDYVGIEGSWVIKRDGIYIHFYSSWSRGYEIGYATAKSPLGPWTKAKNNPFFGAQADWACEKFNMEYTGNRESPFVSVGHNSIFKGPDGRDWITCHYQRDNEAPKLGFDPLEIKNGVVSSPTNGPTYTLQNL